MTTPLPLSATDWSYISKAGCTPLEYYRRLRTLGITAVEMVAPDHRPAARQAGLDIVNLCAPGMREGLNRREHHTELLPAIRACIAEAKRDRIGQVVVFSGNRAGLADADGRAATVEALRAVAPEAQAAGITLVLETLSQQVHPDYQCDRSSWAFAVIDAVASPAVKVLYDAFHMAMMDEDPVAVVAANAARIGHIHLAEIPGRTCLQRQGRPDHRGVLLAAAKAGYRGHAGLEFLPKGDLWAELESSIAALS